MRRLERLEKENRKLKKDKRALEAKIKDQETRLLSREELEYKNYPSYVFKGNAIDYLRMRAKKYRTHYGNVKGACRLDELANELVEKDEELVKLKSIEKRNSKGSGL